MRETELRKGLISCCLTVGTVSRSCCFRNESRSFAGTVHRDDIFVAGHSRRDRELVVR